MQDHMILKRTICLIIDGPQAVLPSKIYEGTLPPSLRQNHSPNVLYLHYLSSVSLGGYIHAISSTCFFFYFPAIISWITVLLACTKLATDRDAPHKAKLRSAAGDNKGQSVSLSRSPAVWNTENKSFVRTAVPAHNGPLNALAFTGMYPLGRTITTSIIAKARPIIKRETNVGLHWSEMWYQRVQQLIGKGWAVPAIDAKSSAGCNMFSALWGSEALCFA